METITLVKDGSRFVAKATYEQRERLKAAGFRWDPGIKAWWTNDAAKAAAVNDPDAVTRFEAERAASEAAKHAAIEASRAEDASVEIPCPESLAYLPYQRAGIAYGLSHTNVLIADEMGLGKTIEAIGIINADATLKRILAICPASLRLNWQREMLKWLVREYRIEIATTQYWPKGADIVIINYDILQKQEANIKAQAWDLVILDESHYLKNPKAKRTQIVCGVEAKPRKGDPGSPGIASRRRVALTGTPIPNRPVEGWSVFHYLDPATFSSFWGYARRYCDAKTNGYGWDMSGASNLAELQDKLRASIMIRRRKADVLKELPAKQRQLIELPRNGAGSAIDAENEAWDRHEEEIARLRADVELSKAGGDYEGAVARLNVGARAAFTEMSALRHRTALAKIPAVIDHILGVLETEGHKVVLFAHHKDVIAAILRALEEAGIQAVSITGDTPLQERQDAVDAFQTRPEVRAFAGNIMAAGVGWTLTAAAHVIFAELDWVPGNVTQAEDRCHRIGQRDSVLVQHLVLDGSLDCKMARSLISKQTIIDKALDADRAELNEEPAEPTANTAATSTLTRDAIAKLAAEFSPERITAIHAGLQMLAGMDTDYARDLNGMGFSRVDVMIGHSLAQRANLTPKQAVIGARLVNKYRRQLPAELVAASKMGLNADALA